MEGSFSLVDGRIYIGTEQGDFVLPQSFDGSTIWKARIGADSDSTPAVANGLVYTAAENGFVLLLQTKLTASWCGSFKAEGGFNYPKIGRGFWASPVVGNGRVFIGSSNGKMYSLSAHTGQVVWEHVVRGPIWGSAPLLRIVSCLGDKAGWIYSLSADDGKRISELKIGDNINATPPWGWPHLYWRFQREALLSEIELLVYLIDNTIDGQGASPRELRSTLGRMRTGLEILIEPFHLVSPARISELGPTHIILSGQSHPGTITLQNHSTELNEAIKSASQPILGVCGGHQQIALAYGACVDLMARLQLVRVTRAQKGNGDISPFKRIGEAFSAGFAIGDDGLALALRRSQRTSQGLLSHCLNETCPIQAMQHESRPVFGVQFHPELFDEQHPMAALSSKPSSVTHAVSLRRQPDRNLSWRSSAPRALWWGRAFSPRSVRPSAFKLPNG